MITKIALGNVGQMHNSFKLGKLGIVLSLIFLLPYYLFGQADRSLMEANRHSIQKRIDQTSEILEKILESKNDKLTELQGLNSQISQVGRLLQQINEELDVLNWEIFESEDVINTLNKDLEELKAEYAAMLYSTYKSNNDIERLSFVFSSKSIGQMFSRLSYFRQYDEYRQYQIEQIAAVMNILEERKQGLVTKRQEKETLQNSLERQQRSLLYMKNKKNRLVKDLLQKEGKLKVQMEKEEVALNALQNAVTKAVTADIASGVSEAAAASGHIENLKGKLPWPVKEGFISRRFGNQPHPIYENIWDDNPGIYITTKIGEKVLSVFPGKVIAVSKPPGAFYYVVTLQHQQYYTNYHRLKNTSVQVGQVVAAGDPLGEVAESDGGFAELLFEVWENLKKQDPEEWLVN
ncbi:peptidoglycan DD-metalloendopeptidase family protein [Flammeovirgaceae bacterium SG7u.111]|nr:peptidoglycan DD-metalloendopeptidase family protein [Flammeovirgaceae bacterium SG7u.132]WPO33973.1 peptidoglycan DD-metalloendopeptidase family protein [Flammeovirgaceae bacterium SG7u.111]